MLTVNLFDAEFTGQACSAYGRTPKVVSYMREQSVWYGVTVFTDRRMFDGSPERVQSAVKAGWLVENRALRPWYYADLPAVENQFDLILTNDPDLLARGGRYHATPHGNITVPDEQQGIWPKSRMVSIIVSDKTELPLHRLRQQAAQLPGLDRFGPSYTVIGRDKGQALRDYRFSIVVEPCDDGGWWSEHLMDVLAFGTVPLFHGAADIGRWFDGRGILAWDTPDDLRDLLAEIARHGPALYRACRSAIAANLRQAQEYGIIDDWIAERVYIPLLERAA